ncbi:hypothetical protein EG68_00938 [Paragonimus skrjabini miyazakii]|uniref:Uncharacterized protein n=1 Tax=Paragonimus skrjabini miyazakii TaxID=59628 RepID=A0A8S9ZBT7_9TREM|nr:hypothetical protein EG68_00938 [Paragonimus skrjabini miyazakii]
MVHILDLKSIAIENEVVVKVPLQEFLWITTKWLTNAVQLFVCNNIHYRIERFRSSVKCALKRMSIRIDPTFEQDRIEMSC